MSGNVIEIPQNKRLAPIWVQQLRVAAYCRVSTGHEEQQSSLKNQIEFYTEYIQQNLYWRFVAVYYDTASGLRRNHRPAYQQLIKDCRRKKIDLILDRPILDLRDKLDLQLAVVGIGLHRFYKRG